MVADCAQAIGARGDSFAIGELSDAVCLSVIIQKNLGCFGDGGAVYSSTRNAARSPTPRTKTTSTFSASSWINSLPPFASSIRSTPMCSTPTCGTSKARKPRRKRSATK
ncbi:MAG: hypothetical protein DMG40_01440 [Acidobacteria bacterium]|nr:MAG: hypothetical protein DMG40_01440 [Acidobacteriota bacterium]